MPEIALLFILRIPLIDAVPLTESLCAGVVVPIPTLPVVVIVMLLPLTPKLSFVEAELLKNASPPVANRSTYCVGAALRSARMVPATASGVEGVVVPIPTFPPKYDFADPVYIE
jgi:hypothetical protein